jgi:hypothetical protein
MALPLKVDFCSEKSRGSDVVEEVGRFSESKFQEAKFIVRDLCVLLYGKFIQDVSS